MENKYITPELEIIEFETEDVITTSGGNNANQELEIIPVS